ncbi:MAG: hypothetical protein R3F41_14435 [Gammaproteobacteria bacterium]|nr:hypothetical protein [Pseudomonadales bacterium]MCP5347175.1 hypothetical protein [Pseudomonadales bacterium]
MPATPPQALNDAVNRLLGTSIDNPLNLQRLTTPCPTTTFVFRQTLPTTSSWVTGQQVVRSNHTALLMREHNIPARELAAWSR